MPEGAQVHVPGGGDFARAARSVRVLGVAAHPDDLECMALGPWTAARYRRASAFGGLVLGDGAGGPPAGEAPGKKVLRRRREQIRAADRGGYAFVVQAGFPSTRLRDAADPGPTEALAELLAAVRPTWVFTHELADPHPTHVAVALRTLKALRRLPAARRPKRVVGLEVWRGLDWLPPGRRVALRGGAESSVAALLRAHRSQDRALGLAAGVLGRRRAHGTFSGAPEPLGWGMDLTALVAPGAPTPRAYAAGLVRSFEREVVDRIRRLDGR